MTTHSNFFSRFLIANVALSASLLAADGQSVSSAVPEPSIAMLAGLFGIFFLFWRKK
jgi:hypothetical protein